MTERIEESPGVSVVVPVYNAEATLEECVRSILDMDYPPDGYELICVDNGSTDRSRAILEGRFRRSRIRVLAVKRNGDRRQPETAGFGTRDFR